MKIVRSILAVVVGVFVAVMVIQISEIAGFLIYRPDNGMSLIEQMTELHENPEFMKEVARNVPASALILVLVGWQVGSFVGGAVSALIAGWARLVHAGIIGGVILAATIMNVLHLKQEYDFTHPDWLLVLGLVLPIPVSLLAGKLVSMRTAPPQPPLAA